MERLTEKRDGQNVIPLRQDRKAKWSLCSAGMGDVPTQFLYGDHADKLAEYEGLEEQGKLLKLPCAVGDTVYRICPKCNDAHDGSCKNCAWEWSYSNKGCTVYGGWKDGQYPAGKCTIVPYKVFWNYIPNLLEHIGKKVFLTREEAEAALKKWEEV